MITLIYLKYASAEEMSSINALELIIVLLPILS